MAASILEFLTGRVRRTVGTLPDHFQIVDWLQYGWDDLQQMREWSWRRARAQFLFYAPYTTGTVSINRGETRATFAGATTITETMTGRQLRIGNEKQILTLTYVDSTHVDVDQPWGSANVSGATFEIYQAFVTAPSDFGGFVVVVDIERQRQVDWWSSSIEHVDAVDPQRSHGGDQAYFLVLRDRATANAGPVSATERAKGTGNKPVAGGVYTGTDDATFVVEVMGATTFRWRKGAADFSSNVTIDVDGAEQALSDGVTIRFPAGVAYTTGDIVTFRARAVPFAGAPRYEPWPHKKVDEALQYLYLRNFPRLDDDADTFVLPTEVRADYLVERALAKCASWRHPNNRYFDPKLAALHLAEADKIFQIMELTDQRLEATDVMYDVWASWPVGLPPLGSTYWQNRDPGPDY